MRTDYTDKELKYSEVARCHCGAGFAHPLDHGEAMKLGAWVCSAVLKGQSNSPAHEKLPFAFYKVREEGSINGGPGLTTRPPGTVARTVGKAECPACAHKWESEPYDASGKSHHWFSGACPECGYAVGGNGSWSSGEGEAIRTRYPTVIIEQE